VVKHRCSVTHACVHVVSNCCCWPAGQDVCQVHMTQGAQEATTVQQYVCYCPLCYTAHLLLLLT
jgi:hypothetical protein